MLHEFVDFQKYYNFIKHIESYVKLHTTCKRNTYVNKYMLELDNIFSLYIYIYIYIY